MSPDKCGLADIFKFPEREISWARWTISCSQGYLHSNWEDPSLSLLCGRHCFSHQSLAWIGSMFGKTSCLWPFSSLPLRDGGSVPSLRTWLEFNDLVFINWMQWKWCFITSEVRQKMLRSFHRFLGCLRCGKQLSYKKASYLRWPCRRNHAQVFCLMALAELRGHSLPQLPARWGSHLACPAQWSWTEVRWLWPQCTSRCNSTRDSHMRTAWVFPEFHKLWAKYNGCFKPLSFVIIWYYNNTKLFIVLFCFAFDLYYYVEWISSFPQR